MQKVEKWYVEIVRYSDEGVENRLGPYLERQADKVDDGLQHQINHEKFFTRVRHESATLA